MMISNEILEKLHQKASFLLLFAERMQAVIPSSASFAGAACIKDVMASSGTGGKLKECDKFKCQTCPNQ